VSEATQVIVSAALGLAFAAVILLLARRGRLSMRYTLGWLFVAVCVMIGSLFAGLARPLARFIGVSPQALIITTAMLALLSLTVQLSITVSGLTERVRTLAESNAILEEVVKREAPRSHTGGTLEDGQLGVRPESPDRS
jgi:hypothetical protein